MIYKWLCNDHTHAADIGQPEALKIRLSVKPRAMDTVEIPQQVITQELCDSTESAAVELPVIHNICCCIRRYHQVAGNVPANLQTSIDLVLPEEFTHTLADEPFLLFGSSPVEDQILLFSTDRNLQILGHPWTSFVMGHSRLYLVCSTSYSPFML